MGEGILKVIDMLGRAFANLEAMVEQQGQQIASLEERLPQEDVKPNDPTEQAAAE